MNREEAIKIFQLMKKILSIPNSDAARTIEAIDMAIEALHDVIKSQNDVIKKPKTVRYKLRNPIEYVSIEFDEEETITHIDHYTAYGERREE